MAKFFPKPSDFREWLAQNHQSETELWVGFYKKATGLESITWPESVDQALCFGWIDGIRKRIDEESYQIRFTPRKARSHWSDVNIRKMAELEKQGLIEKAGREAFALRQEENSRQASYEKEPIVLSDNYLNEIKKNEKAYTYYQCLSPSVQKQYVSWLMGAKKEETRENRLKIMIECSAEGKLIPPLKWLKRSK